MECAETGSGGDDPQMPRIELPAILDLTVAGDLKRELDDALTKGQGLEVDAAGVTRVTTPCLQVLAAAAHTFVKSGGPAMRFGNISPKFGETVAVLGLDRVLGIEGL